MRAIRRASSGASGETCSERLPYAAPRTSISGTPQPRSSRSAASPATKPRRSRSSSSDGQPPASATTAPYSSGAACVSASLPMSESRPQRNASSATGWSTEPRERARDHGVQHAAVPVDVEVEPGRDALLRHLAREREAERDDLQRPHADHHRRAVQRGDLGAAVVERRVRDAQHLAGEHRIAREHVGELGRRRRRDPSTRARPRAQPSAGWEGCPRGREPRDRWER